MKIYPVLILLIACSSIWCGCNKNESDLIESPNVEIFIKQLNSGKYDALTLPEFTWHDIPALLTYRDNTQLIFEYPVNPISSLRAVDCELGIYVLWTIESIRVRSIEKDIMGFPSQNPVLGLKKYDELQLVSKKESHRIASEAYYKWWIKNKHKHFHKFCDIDPLKNTNYRWH